MKKIFFFEHTRLQNVVFVENNSCEMNNWYDTAEKKTEQKEV